MLTDIRARDSLVHTMGNLTLITVPGNTVASNSDFTKKKPWLSQSLLALNLEITANGEWDHQAITTRSLALAARAATIWPMP
jgi:hypothetical protein